MSLILSGPRRVYVVLLFWDRLDAGCSSCPATLSRTRDALGVDARGPAAPCRSWCRLLFALGAQRAIGRRLVGVRLLVLGA